MQVQALRECWGSQVADVVVAECSKVNFGGNCGEFLDHCVMCGGNWVGMFLTGVQALFPMVYEVLPDSLGRNGNEAFINLCYVLQLCGVNTAE